METFEENNPYFRFSIEQISSNKVSSGKDRRKEDGAASEVIMDTVSLQSCLAYFWGPETVWHHSITWKILSH